MFDEQKIIERIKKMLALSRDKGATEGEREAAMRAVHKYLKAFNLDIATVENAQSQTERRKESEEGGPRTHHTGTFYGRPWAKHAASAIGDLCYCMYLYSSARQSKDSKHYFIGRAANAITAAYLAEFVCVSIHNEGRQRQRREGRDNPWFLSFALGAAHEIQVRCYQLKSAKENRVDNTPGTELVLADYYNREKEANRQYQQINFRTKKGSSGKGVRDLSAHAEGRAYGSTINLNRQVK